MAKIQFTFFVTCFLFAQQILTAQQKHYLVIETVDKPKTLLDTLQLETIFEDSAATANYINQIVPLLYTKGFVTASVDSVYGISKNQTAIKLFIGAQYRWQQIYIEEESRKLLTDAGFSEKQFLHSNFIFEDFNRAREKVLRYFETIGYPFAGIFFDSIQIKNNNVLGRLKVDMGPQYRIDSIKILGSAKISNDYLQRYLNIKNGSVYNREKLERISDEIRKLNYVEETLPPKFYWGSTGGTVEVYLKEKKSNQVNFIVGFLPNSDQQTAKKMTLTGEGLLHLKNALGSGETIGLVWKRLQAASQQLHMNYNQPYLFKSPLGLDFAFDMLKIDSSFLNIDLKLGSRYVINPQQSVALYFQQSNSVVSNIDTAYVVHFRKLPQEANIKVSKIGFEYSFNNTNYIYNPVRGNDLSFLLLAGNRRIKPNSEILELQDPNDPSFKFSSLYDTVRLRSLQARIIIAAAKFLPLSKSAQSTLKTALNIGYISGGNLYRNELFQIGGYRLLRGFDEQSQYLSQYGIGTLEYRYLVGENSFFNVFSDFGWGSNNMKAIQKNYSFIGLGLGMAFETKVGIFNLSWAVGKRNDTRFNLRQSKIHFGFINYF